MSNVEEWARKVSRRSYPNLAGYGVGFRDGAKHLAALLLSDEAVEQGSARFWEIFTEAVQGQPSNLAAEHSRTAFRAALQAALDKITEGKE